MAALGKPTLFTENNCDRPTFILDDEDEKPDYFYKCPRFREAIDKIRKRANPASVAGIPIRKCALLPTSTMTKDLGVTKIYDTNDGRIERVSSTIDRTMSYMCCASNEATHIASIHRYALDPVNYKTFSDYFCSLLPKHFVRVNEAHLCFFEHDSPDILPHSHVLMEKINGMSLIDYIKSSDIPIEIRMACVAQAAYILIVVANHGFIHNDPRVYNFIVSPCDEAFEINGAFLPISTHGGDGAGAYPGIVQQSFNLAFPRGTPRVVLIDYGDSMKIAEGPIFPVESQKFIKDIKAYIPSDKLEDALATFKDMGMLFHLPTPIEHVDQITRLEETSQLGLMRLIQRLSRRVGGKRRTMRRHRKQKKTLKKRNHK